MIVRIYMLVSLALLALNILSQDVTGFEDQLDGFLSTSLIPDSVQLDNYYDSVKADHKEEILTGFTYSVHAEPSPNVNLEYSFDGKEFIKFQSDSFGRYFIPIPDYTIKEIHLKSWDKGFHPYDTIIQAPIIAKRHIPIQLSPRFKIVLRGRLFVGSLATEGIDVTIIHGIDTFRLKTLGCYTDNEDYWNCLYIGMFKQTIIFDDPRDSVYMFFYKAGFEEQKISMTVSEYDGTILPIKLNYSEFLPKFPIHNLTIKYSPPISDVWSVGLDYTYIARIGNFNRLAIGIEASMLITDLSTEQNTFPDVSSLPDTNYIVGRIDSTYNMGVIMPHLTFWLTNPERRFYSFYAGIGFPFMMPNNKFYLQPFLGGRIYLDINKALLLELKYVNYELDVAKYDFNPYGNAYRYTENQVFNKLMFNLGLQVSF